MKRKPKYVFDERIADGNHELLVPFITYNAPLVKIAHRFVPCIYDWISASDYREHRKAIEAAALQIKPEAQFYARAARYTKDWSVELKVPLIVAPEDEVVFGQRVYPIKIGGWYMPCVWCWVNEEYYHTHKCDIEQQSKEAEREHRCWRTNGHGGRIRCPEENHCIDCPYAKQFDFDNGHDASYDALTESSYDPETGEEIESDFDFAEQTDDTDTDECKIEIRRMFEAILAASPKHGYAALLMSKGVNGADFAERLKLGHTAANDVRKQVEALAPDKIWMPGQIKTTGLKANRSKNDDYYLAEACKLLDALVKLDRELD